jgi:hypothetical protein
VTIEEFCKFHPKLFHMAVAGSLGQIRKHGLLSTDAILSLLDVEPDFRQRLTTKHRPQMTPLNHPEHGQFTLRDQKPLRDVALEKCLDGMTVSQWYASLNGRVFMWASRERVDRLLAARAYRSQDQLVLTIDSAALLAKYYDNIQISTINSGATLFKPVRRGVQTFIPLNQYESTTAYRPIAEVTVPGGVPDMRDFIVSAETRKATV